MGSFVSLFLGGVVAVFIGEPEEADARSLLELLDEVENDNGDDNNNNNHWELICRRLQRHPEEAAAYCQTVDPSPLLRASTSGPVAVIRAFLDAYEDAAFHADRHGVTPLQAAIGKAGSSHEIVRLLLEANPGAASHADKTGKLPLHFVKGDASSAECLLEAHPSGAWAKDEEGRLPLHYFCESTGEQEGNQEETRSQQASLPNPDIARVLLRAMKSSTTNNPILVKDRNGLTPLDLLYQSLATILKERQPDDNDSRLDTLWQVLFILAQSAASTTPKFQIVHSLVSLHCPALIMTEALRRFPQQAVERDAQGRTPLLIAVHLLDHESEGPAVICELLSNNAAAARMTDREGRLAIDALAEKGIYNEALFEAMVQAEPRAIDTRDLKNKQHPFVTAALAGDKSNISSVYHLLRAKPHVMRHFIERKDP